MDKWEQKSELRNGFEASLEMSIGQASPHACHGNKCLRIKYFSYLQTNFIIIIAKTHAPLG